jgi:translation initiation factor 3 subunit B
MNPSYTGMGNLPNVKLRIKDHANPYVGLSSLTVLKTTHIPSLRSPSHATPHPKQEHWTELYVSWSQQGTYFATLHRKGVCLWGGPSFQLLQRFAHPRAKMINFSLCERYLVTCSFDGIVVPEGAERGSRYFSPDDAGNQIAVWDVKSGELIRTFPAVLAPQDDEGPSGTATGGGKKVAWPQLKWSPDDRYVGRVTPGQQISIYELPGMGLEGKKSLKIEGVVDFEWCPIGDRDREDGTVASSGKKTGGAASGGKENMLAYWTPEVANQPARVTLLGFPSRTVLRQKNLFNVSDVSPTFRS